MREITTKKGDRMVFARLADMNDQIEMVVFSRLYATHKELFQPDKCLAIRGKISQRNGEVSIVVEGAKEL